MAKKASKRKRRTTRIKTPSECYFCTRDKEPDYKDYKTLQKFLTDRAKIIGKERSGFCSKHQRRYTVAVKRARHLGLLPFTPAV